MAFKGGISIYGEQAVLHGMSRRLTAMSPYVHSFLYIGIYLLYIYILWTIHYNSWYMQTVHLCMNNVHSYKYIYGIVLPVFLRGGAMSIIVVFLNMLIPFFMKIVSCN